MSWTWAGQEHCEVKGYGNFQCFYCTVCHLSTISCIIISSIEFKIHGTTPLQCYFHLSSSSSGLCQRFFQFPFIQSIDHHKYKSPYTKYIKQHNQHRLKKTNIFRPSGYRNVQENINDYKYETYSITTFQKHYFSSDLWWAFLNLPCILNMFKFVSDWLDKLSHQMLFYGFRFDVMMETFVFL